jgi:RHS repeat-associated protein
VMARYSYTDYGTPTIYETTPPNDTTQPGEGVEVPNPFQYSGEYTTVSGTQYLGDRTYDPTQARFRTADTASMHNLYGYANANPITLIDPTGQTPEKDDQEHENDNDSILQAVWFKILFLVINIVLTVIGFMGINPLTAFNGVIAAYRAGHALGIGSALIGAVGTGLAVVDTTNGVMEEGFLNSEQAEIVQVSSILVGVVGGIGAGVAKLVRKYGIRQLDKKTQLTVDALEATENELATVKKELVATKEELVATKTQLAAVEGAEGGNVRLRKNSSNKVSSSSRVPDKKSSSTRENTPHIHSGNRSDTQALLMIESY